MSPEISKKQGTPNWADCATTDLDGSEQFYATVFGWTSKRIRASDGAIYAVQRLEGKMVAGIYELNQEMRSMGVPPHWGTYIEVDDVDTTLERVRAEGGSVPEPPMEEPGVGKIAVIQDSVGAYLRLWHSAPGQGGEVFNVSSAMTWNELNTKDPEEAARFYARVLGVEIERLEDPAPYTLLKVDDRPVAGILETTPEMGDLPPSWDVYFACDDVDAVVDKAIEAGGKALRMPFDIPGNARMAVLQDPQGAVFELVKMAAAQD